jgi:hypothetical protein
MSCERHDACVAFALGLSPWRSCAIRACSSSSFFDVQAFLRSLKTREKAELVEAISRIVARYPQVLALLGVQGFDDEDSDPDAWTD